MERAVWPAFPIMLPYEVTRRPSHVALEYAGVVAPLHLVPCYYNSAIEKPSPKEKKKLLLDRSIFDLVEDHKYLSLTDQRLLGWYLSLLPEYRKIIQDEGGFHQFLHRHPALELTQHHVYVKHISCGHQNSEMLPNNVRETWTMFGRRNGGEKPPHEVIRRTTPLVHQQDCVQTAFSNPTMPEPNHRKAHTMISDPSWRMSSNVAGLANCSLDIDLERRRQDGMPELSSQTATTQGHSANITHEVSPLQSEWTKTESPEYYSFDSVQMDDTEYGDMSIIQAVELEQVSPVLDPVVENGKKKGGQDQETGNEYVDDAILSFGNQSDTFHSIMENDKSILACLTSKDGKVLNNGVQSGPLITSTKALAASRETLNSDQSVMKNTAEKHTSTMPCATTCDIMVGTELAICMSNATQTENSKTADKHVNTEVHMTDLDYLTEEFLKLKMAQEELIKKKDKRKSLGCKVRKECDFIQRAQQAEMSLLALQYSMCRHHCWRLYYTSAEGGHATPVPNNPPVDIVSVLQKLESDYNQMKDKILTGVPLEQLKPLSVDSEKITTGASYSPAQIIDDVLGIVPSWSSQEPQKHDTSVEENGCPDDQSTNGCQPSQRKEKRIKDNNAVRAITLVAQDIHTHAHKPAERQTTKCKELNTSEAWYDAEEDVKPAVATQTGQDTTVIAKDKTNESTSTEVQSSVLCVSNLPSNVTESNVMQWFEKYHVSEVSFPALKNDVRVAIVVINGLQSAKDAARELHGCCMQGHTLHVEHTHKAIGESQASASISGSELSHDADKPQTSKTDSSSTERNLKGQPPLGSSVKHRKVVSISPTAKGTCVPQHYGTMGSFDILMSELTQRHPDVKRQRIVDALMELKTKHQGVLSGLPLRTIREMTSELLTTPASDAVIRKQSSVL